MRRRERWVGLLAALAAVLVSAAAFAQDAARLAACAGCHGADGNSRQPLVPSLAGQPPLFLENYLVLTREGLRGSETMQTLLAGVSDPEIRALAAHYARLPAEPAAGAADPARFERGRQVAGERRCGSCHRPDFRGQQQVPRLAGQREDFLGAALRAYRDDRRPGGDTIMAASLYGIPAADLDALAHYFAQLR